MASDSFTPIPLSPIRQVIAARMTEAIQTIPHFRVSADIRIDELLSLRQELRNTHREEDVSLNDLIVKACAGALMETSGINIQWADSEIREFKTADISVVIALKDGLATPIVRNADQKTIWEISREVRELTARAQRNALKMDEIVGGSFSVSNLGMYGIDEFDAIINPPQCAILAVGSAKPRIVVSEDHATRVATVLRATLSCDHRAIDGATAATFLSGLKRRVEHPGDLYPKTERS
jgi:pyruvate dehydrogenase E2 component (dihydrolipoamide acetyltransferase)